MTAALEVDEWSAARPGRILPGTQFTGGWVTRLGTEQIAKVSFEVLTAVWMNIQATLAATTC